MLPMCFCTDLSFENWDNNGMIMEEANAHPYQIPTMFPHRNSRASPLEAQPSHNDSKQLMGIDVLHLPCPTHVVYCDFG